ncbi:hypothetical protein [Alteribacter populi]|uniref:family 4 glycosyl hydrolase n=1 Tax=Alteribacter populi TaxID=2011011 RepID=UPI000BBB1303
MQNSASVTEALLKFGPHKKVIGVCNIPFNMRTSAAEILNCEVKDTEIEFVGLNHFVFGKRVMVKGKDRTQEVLEKLVNNDMDYSPANIVSLGWSPAFIEALNMLPNPYHQYYFQTDKILKKDLEAYEENGTRAKVVMEVEKELFKTYQDFSLKEKPAELEKRGGAFYSDAACNLIESLYTNKSDIQTLNIQNRGAISDLPADSVIEVNAIVTTDGPRPITVGLLPSSVKGLIVQMKAFEELVIEAAISGEYLKAYQAIVMNPLVDSEKKAKAILNEMLDAHKEYLPQF